MTVKGRLLWWETNFYFDNQHDSEVCKLKSLLNDYCLQQLVNQPTHRCGHTLDWVIIRDDSVIIDNVGVIDTALSDHRTVFSSLSPRKPGRAKQQVTSRNLRRIDPTRFQTDISQLASSLAECPDSELIVEFNASLRNILYRHAPLVTRIVPARPPVPWITEEVKATKCNLCKAERQWRSGGLTVHKVIFFFVKQRNLKIRVILSAKRKHYCEKLRVQFKQAVVWVD